VPAATLANKHSTAATARANPAASCA
jgi:hypothetical protein